MATYNGEKYIEEQLNSILPQLLDEDEVIISDDHSSDRTLEIISNLQDGRIKVVQPVVSKGPIFNFEHALHYASREVIVLSDQDDVWLPNRLAWIREYFRDSRSRYDLLTLDSRAVDQHLQVIEPSVFAFLNAGPGLIKNIYKNTYIGCHMAFKRELLEVALPFPKHISMHDVWLGLVSEVVGRVHFLAKPSMLFRRTGNNFTKPKYPWSTRMSWRLYMSVYIMRLIFLRPRLVFSKAVRG